MPPRGSSEAERPRENPFLAHRSRGTEGLTVSELEASGLGKDAADKLASLGVTVADLGTTTTEIRKKAQSLADECVPPDRPEWAK